MLLPSPQWANTLRRGAYTASTTARSQNRFWSKLFQSAQIYRGAVSFLLQVRRLMLASGDEFLLLACDGIWDVLTNQQVTVENEGASS